MSNRESDKPRKNGNGSIPTLDVAAFGQAPSVLSRADVAFFTGTPLPDQRVTREPSWYDEES